MHPLFAEIEAILVKAGAEAARAKRAAARLCALIFTPLPGRRPAVLPAALRSELDDLRAFRHRVRNLYGSELMAAIVQKKAAQAPAAVARVRRALRAFETAVTRSAKSGRKPSRQSR